MTTLLDAVDALTKPHKSSVIQMNDAGITCTSPVELPPLLDQLNEAIRANMGGSTLGASDPATRSLLNAAAFAKFSQIRSQVDDWARMAGADIDKGNAGNTLRAWHAKFVGTLVSPEVETAYVRTLTGWASQIVTVLDPPREKDLPDACPGCGATEWWDQKARERYYRPLIIRYRPGESVDDAQAMCRACADVWTARELAFELEQAAQRQEPTG